MCPSCSPALLIHTNFPPCRRSSILLHDPHAIVGRRGCISAIRILEAARNTLNLLYAIFATSFDISLLDGFCCVRRFVSVGILDCSQAALLSMKIAFFMAGKVLVRFVQGAKEAGDETQLLTYRTELEFIRYVSIRFLA